MKIIPINQSDGAFPDVLRSIPAPPKRLFVLGNLAPLLKRPRLAVVGSRKVSAYGRLVTRQLAGEVAGKGIVVVSGLALGVDALAHQATLDSGGQTIAVLANGLDQIHPATNHDLAKRILESGGAIVSEYPAGTPPYRDQFIARNRLVSGLSDAVLITEAAAKSGTMHTANFALEQGKSVMAVPGNINSVLSEGTNNLIKTGALPVTSASDILFALGLEETQAHQQEIFGATPEEVALLQELKKGTTEAAELQTGSGLDAATFNQTLTMLEIAGKIRPLGAGHWGLK